MATEIEHKYLVNDDWKKATKIHSSPIKQWYISTDINRIVRVRIQDGIGIICLKGKSHLAARKEVEAVITVEEAEELLSLMAWGTSVVEKIRHLILGPDNMQWEVDEFVGENAGLVVAEIELPEIHTKYQKPDWVEQDVTNTYIYSNSHLAEVPFTTWSYPDEILRPM
jgi:adenylate cyclase